MTLNKALTPPNSYIHASHVLFSVCIPQLFVTWLAKVLRSGTSAIKESQVTAANFCFSIPFSLKYQQNGPRLLIYSRHLLKAFFQTRYHDGSDVLAGSVDRERWYHLAIATTIAS